MIAVVWRHLLRQDAANSEAIVTEKAENVIQSGADVLVGADMGCLMNIQGRMEKMGRSIEVMHIAQLIDQAQGGKS